MTGAKGRNGTLDIMKAIAIISVVIYHLVYRKMHGVIDNLIREMIYLSIPMFFMLAGYFYKNGKNLISTLAHRMKKLVLPAAVTMAVLLLLFGPYFMLTRESFTAKNWLGEALLTYLRPELMEQIAPEFGSGDQLFFNLSPVWFIWTLAWASLLFYLVVYFVYDSDVKMLISSLLLIAVGCVLYVLVDPLSWSLQITPLYAGLIMLGAYFGKHDLTEILDRISLVPSLILTLICMVGHYLVFENIGTDLMYMSILDKDGTVVGGRTYLAAAYFVVETLIGSFALYKISAPIKKAGRFGECMQWIGRNTLNILLYHCLIGGIAADIMHTYNKPGPDWYMENVEGRVLTTDVVVKSWITFIVSMVGCMVICRVLDKIKAGIKSKKQSA